MSEAYVKKGGYKKKGGTHGSLNKAGKTRDQNRRQWHLQDRKTKDKIPYKHLRKHDCPRVAKRKRLNVMLNRMRRKREGKGRI